MTGEWSGELVVKEYTEVDPDAMAKDPAEYAVEHGLVDVHDEHARHTVGAWRWKGLIEHRHRIVELLRQGPSMDFGGFAAPVGYGATVVDFFSQTMRAPYDMPGRVKTVFSSHTFEHVPDLVPLLAALTYKIERPGHLIVFVPSHFLEHLQADNWPHHCHTFCLSTEGDLPMEWIRLDKLLAMSGKLELVTYTGDGCLLGIVGVL